MASTENLSPELDTSFLPQTILQHKGTRRIGHYLYTNGQLRIWRTPYQCWAYHSKDNLVAITADHGNGVRRARVSTRKEANTITRWIPESTVPVSDIVLLRWERMAHGAGPILLNWETREILERFASVPVTLEDGYASGNCRTDSKRWMQEGFPGRSWVTVEEALRDRRKHPDARRAACWAIAFVWGRRPLLELPYGLAPGQLENAQSSGQKHLPLP